MTLTGHAFKSEKGATLFFLLRVLFPPVRIKQRHFADKATPHLLGDTCFATSLQWVGKMARRTFAPASWHTPTGTTPCSTHRNALCCSFSIPGLFQTSSASEEITFPLKKTALLHFLCVLALCYFQHFCYTGCSVGSPGVKIQTHLYTCWASTLDFLLLRGLTFSSFLLLEWLIQGHHSTSAFLFQSHLFFLLWFILWE